MAVLRLMTSSNFVGSSEGRSAGLAHSKIFSRHVELTTAILVSEQFATTLCRRLPGGQHPGLAPYIGGTGPPDGTAAARRAFMLRVLLAQVDEVIE